MSLPQRQQPKTMIQEDRRSDAEILGDLQNFKPVPEGDEKNIWGFWKQGLAACPAWEQRNIVSWVRRCEKDGWTVRIVDMVPNSPTHASRYISAEYFPACFLRDTLAGPYTGPHSSDIVRLPLIYLYGGVWLDVGFTLFRSLDSLVWDVLSEPSRQEEMSIMRISLSPTLAMCFNGFIACRKGCVAVKYWHELFLKIWEGKKSTVGAHAHPSLHHLPPYVYPELSAKVPKMFYKSFHDYLAQVLCMERLRHTIDEARGWDGPAYFQHNALVFDVVTEAYWGQKLSMWDGRKQFEMLRRPRIGADADPSSPEWKEAESFVQGILARSSTQKLSHGMITTGKEWLACIWDKPENANCDNIPGSFGAHLREAAISFEQRRPLEPCRFPVVEPALIKGDLFLAAGQPFVVD